MVVTVLPEKPQAEPVWDVALLFPNQGHWSVDDFVALTNSTNRLVEFQDGCIEVLPAPSEAHQFVVRSLFLLLHAVVSVNQRGEVIFAPIRIRTLSEKYREPDIVMMLAEHRDRRTNEFWNGADLVMEVVSDDPESRKRDLITKRTEYAAARIPEYWIVDLEQHQISVLRLQNEQYVEHGIFRKGETAISSLLADFHVDVSTIFAAAEQH